jgi:hypothetical protein
MVKPVSLVMLLSIGSLALADGVAQAQQDRRDVTRNVERLFRNAEVCMSCHNGLFTPAGEDISIGTDWRASMMANSARDPYWQAAVRREVIDHPAAAAAIENECSTCHMPMSHVAARAAGLEASVFDHLPASDATTPTDSAAVDGVSCTVCHQIEDAKLGTPESFTGGFVIDTDRPWGERLVFGPFRVDSGRTTVMRSASRFRPWPAAHIATSDFCATCHTLYTQTRGARGAIIGTLPEQVPFLEWRHSAYRHDRSCQSCHMPVVEDSVPITSVLGQPRDGFSRHVFRGANFFVLRMLNRFRDELGVAALPQELEAEANRTIDHLQTLSARVAIDRAELRDGRLTATVVVQNLAGHKLPTAYPSRRAWLHVTVRDASAATVFESGAFTERGSIAGNDNDDDPRRYERHYESIDRPDQVQIYEGILADSAGGVTTGLLTALRFVKDNRLLPVGFEKATAEPDIAVRGEAARDPDFRGGEDRITYSIQIGRLPTALTVDVQLWYQPIAFRWAENLRPYSAFETARFSRYYDAMADASAIVIARSSATVRP